MLSDRLRYSNLSETDLIELHSCLSDPQVTEPIYWLNTPFRKEDAQSLVRKAIIEQKAQTDYWLATRQQTDGKYIGNINIHKRQNGKAEIGYWIAKEFWNNGYATEMVKYAVSFAFGIDNINHLIATTAVENIGSQVVLSKNGFEFEKLVSSPSSIDGTRESKLYKRTPF